MRKLSIVGACSKGITVGHNIRTKRWLRGAGKSSPLKNGGTYYLPLILTNFDQEGHWR